MRGACLLGARAGAAPPPDCDRYVWLPASKLARLVAGAAAQHDCGLPVPFSARDCCAYVPANVVRLVSARAGPSGRRRKRPRSLNQSTLQFGRTMMPSAEAARTQRIDTWRRLPRRSIDLQVGSYRLLCQQQLRRSRPSWVQMRVQTESVHGNQADTLARTNTEVSGLPEIAPDMPKLLCKQGVRGSSPLSSTRLWRPALLARKSG